MPGTTREGLLNELALACGLLKMIERDSTDARWLERYRDRLAAAIELSDLERPELK